MISYLILSYLYPLYWSANLPEYAWGWSPPIVQFVSSITLRLFRLLAARVYLMVEQVRTKSLSQIIFITQRTNSIYETVATGNGNGPFYLPYCESIG